MIMCLVIPADSNGPDRPPITTGRGPSLARLGLHRLGMPTRGSRGALTRAGRTGGLTGRPSSLNPDRLRRATNRSEHRRPDPGASVAPARYHCRDGAAPREGRVPAVLTSVRDVRLTEPR